MKKITLLITMFLFVFLSWQGFAQLTEDFETDPPSGWTFMSTEVDDPGFVQTSSRVHGGSFSFYHNDDNIANVSTSYMISPAYTVMTGDELKFWYNQNYATSYYNYTGVWISTTSSDPIANPGDFTELEEFGQTSEDAWTEKTYDLSAYVGQQVYIAFKYTGDWATELYIDDFSIANPPSCPAPSGMLESNLTETSVDLIWATGATETMWEVVYDADPYAMPANGVVDASTEPGYNHVTVQSLSLTGLMPNTTYNVYYRAHCGGTDYSDWVAYSFTTPATPPANDDCANAMTVPVNTDATCANVISGTIAGATDSGVSDNGSGTPNDDVWFSFVATADTHVIKMLNKAGTYQDLVHEVLSGDCATLVSVNVSDPDTSQVSGLTVGDTYYLRVFGWSSTAGRDTTFDVCVSTLPPPPANDDCAGVIDLSTLTSPLNATTESAVHDYDQDCLNTTAPDVVYSILVPAENTLTIVQLSNDYDSVFRVAYGGTCPGENLINCTDDPEFDPIHWYNDTCQDQTVYWVQSGYSSQSGNFELEWMVTPPSAPANDDLANATTLTVYATGASAGNEVMGNTTSATASAISATSCDGVGTNLDVFYSFTVPAGETGVVAYFTGCIANNMEATVLDSTGTEVAGTCQNNGSTHLFEGLTGGDTYTLQVWNDDFNAGSFSVALESVPPPPVNDDCANAEVLTVGVSRNDNVVSGTNISASDSGEVIPSCASYAGGDVWYSAVVPANGNLIVETMPNPSGDGGLAVYSGTCGNLTELACDDDGGDGLFGKIELTGLTPGDTLLIRVWEYGNNAIINFNVVAYSPTCNVPSNVALDAITTTSATISWDAGASGETMWDIEWGPDPLTQGSGTMIDDTTDNPYTFTGLMQETTYVFYLRAACSATDSSDWIGPFSFTTPAPPPANDDCANAITIACDDLIAGDTTNATPETVGAYTGANEDAKSVWYTFVGDGSAVTLSTCNDTPDTIPGDATYDTKIDVYSGDCATLTHVGGNDDGGGCAGFSSLVSNLPTVNGTTYYVRVYGYSSASQGQFNLSMTCTPACTPAVTNQDCATALPLVLNDPAVSSDNTCATANVNNPSCDLYGTIADVWFSVEVPNSGELNVTTTLGTATDVNVAVYEGACGSLTEVANGCADAPGVANSLALTGLNPGDTYYIQVWNAGVGEEGTFDVEVTGTVVSVGDLESVGFMYYPNPVENSLMLKANENISSVNIYNMLGQEVKSITPSALQASIDMSNLSNGTYFVKAKVGNAIGTFKVVKN
jgi:hypothetical protein